MNVGYIGAIAIPSFAAYLAQRSDAAAASPYAVPLAAAYCASLCLMLGKIIFFVTCPKIISYYNNFTRYASEFDDLVRALNTIADAEAKAAKARIHDSVEKTLIERGAPEAKAAEFAARMAEAQERIAKADAKHPIEKLVLNFHSNWVVAEHKLPLVRGTVGALYAMSALFAAYLFFLVGVELVGALQSAR